MSLRPEQILIYHITDVENLPGILAKGGLCSDAAMAMAAHNVIGYDHIKERRLKKIRVPCCGQRFVGEFVPFYFCARSPMLFTTNKGQTGRLPGCQKSIVHLVSTVAMGIRLERAWAISDGNAGAFHTFFYAELDAINILDWRAIKARDWRGKTHQKSAEFLIADFFPWTGVQEIGCHNLAVTTQVRMLLQDQAHRPIVNVKSNWYY